MKRSNREPVNQNMNAPKKMCVEKNEYSILNHLVNTVKSIVLIVLEIILIIIIITYILMIYMILSYMIMKHMMMLFEYNNRNYKQICLKPGDKTTVVHATCIVSKLFIY